MSAHSIAETLSHRTYRYDFTILSESKGQLPADQRCGAPSRQEKCAATLTRLEVGYFLLLIDKSGRVDQRPELRSRVRRQLV